MGIQLDEDMVDVAFDCPDRNHELLSNFMVRSPAGHEAQHLQLAFADVFARTQAVPRVERAAATC